MKTITVDGITTEDLTGQVFTRLTVVEFGGFSPHGLPKWICRCEDGVITPPIFASNLKKGHTTSCGCLQAERTAESNHLRGSGLFKADHIKEYNAWAGAKQRTSNPNHHRRKWYFDKGIKMCSAFRESFKFFFETIGPCPSPDRSLDRTNYKGHYSCGTCEECLKNGWPMNVRWATKEEQMNNMCTNQWVEWNGVSMTVAQLSDLENLNRNSVYWLLGAGLPLEECVRRTRL